MTNMTAKKLSNMKGRENIAEQKGFQAPMETYRKLVSFYKNHPIVVMTHKQLFEN